RAGKESSQLVAGVVPMLLIAAFVEGFVSPSNLPASLKVTLAVVLAAAYTAYIVSCSRRAELDGSDVAVASVAPATLPRAVSGV
ncbi:MAG TPA: stage II sporulation protein M, partial [Pirellulales bacterium]|nr:stage II sporulation protein M [Pirellulales bacterium]